MSSQKSRIGKGIAVATKAEGGEKQKDITSPLCYRGNTKIGQSQLPISHAVDQVNGP